MMRSCNEQKEDIRLRMAELEKKLVESEQERQKLEKTCNVLTRAFREEEKMRYKALNKKYEKFLEDCSMRRRRNDIILRSLCRIEDRSKALSAKTERLKLMKDRCMSYLKIKEISPSWRNVSSSNDVIAESSRWKILLTEQLEELKANLFSRQEHRCGLFNEFNSRSLGVEKYHHREIFLECEPPGKSDPELVLKSFHSEITPTPSHPVAVEIKSEEPARNVSRGICRKPNTESDKIKIESAEMQTQIVTQVAGIDELTETQKTVEPAENEINAVTGQSRTQERLLDSDHFAVTASPEARDKEHEDQLKLPLPETDPSSEKNFPQGLDGVDYQNETYPESYYEQPSPRHNHTSIVADVILEEDETEPDADEVADGDGHGETTWQQRGAVELRTDNEQSEEDYKHGDGPAASERVKGQESDSEKSSMRSSGTVSDGGGKNRSAGKSNLMRMLESDSESFQIEHGDEVSGQEDSDFDFSFGRN